MKRNLDAQLSRLFQQHVGFILSLQNVRNKKQRRALVLNASKRQLDAVKRLLCAFLKTNCTTQDESLKKKICRGKKHMAILAEPIMPANIEAKKKILTQKGGFLGALIPLITSVVLPAIANVL